MRTPNVYIETSIVSDLSAKLSRDLFVAACQQVTSGWWEDKQTGYDFAAGFEIFVGGGSEFFGFAIPLQVPEGEAFVPIDPKLIG